jgi:predicted amidohydrolase
MFNVSCIQLTSDNNVFSNLEKTIDLIVSSIKNKADLIITPENTSLFTLNHNELLEKSSLTVPICFKLLLFSFIKSSSFITSLDVKSIL